jgi:phospholipid transport system transporter-binding protein
MAEHRALRARVAELRTARAVTVDWSAVEGADSSALTLMLAWKREAEARGITLRHRALPVALLALADLYGVRELLSDA